MYQAYAFPGNFFGSRARFCLICEKNAQKIIQNGKLSLQYVHAIHFLAAFPFRRNIVWLPQVWYV